MKDKKNKKILFIANTLTHHKIFNYAIIQNMAKKGFDVKIVSMIDSRKNLQRFTDFEIINWTLDRGSTNITKEFFAFINIYKIIKKEKPDLIYNFTIKANIYASIAGKILKVKKIINTVTGLGYTYTDKNFSTLPIRTLIKILWTISLNFSDLIMFMNFTDKKILGKYVYKAKKFVIPGHGIDENFYSKNAADKKQVAMIKKQLEISPRDVIIVTVGRLIKHKGINEFAKAAVSLMKKHRELKFVIVGMEDRQNPTSIPDLEIENFRNNGIKVLKNRSDVREILCLSDIFVLMSHMEAVPQVIIEAMSMKLPIITTDTAGCNERVEVNKNGYLVAVGDHKALAKRIVKLAQNKEKRISFGKYSRKIVEKKYSREKMTEKIAKIIAAT